MKPTTLFLIIVLASTGCTGSTDELTTFILIRHAEKGNDGTEDPDLSDEGRLRAEKLAGMFKDTPLAAIYSTNYKRTKQTVEPLAKLQNLETRIFEPFRPDVMRGLIEEHRGGTILVSGHSNTTPWTANLLMGQALYKDYAESDYGIILIVSVAGPGRSARVTRINY